MEQLPKLVERRKYPRYFPDRKNQPKVSFALHNGDRIALEVVNISGGGLFGYTSNIDQSLTKDQKIENIEIQFQNSRLLRCSGKLIRLQPTRKKFKCFCAIEFATNGVDEKQNPIDLAYEIEQALLPVKKNIIPDQHFINRLKNAENYMRIEDLNVRSKSKIMVYDSFDDITRMLSWEEKWWFFEVLDELKRFEPDYPENLQQTFVKLCRTGMELQLEKNNKFFNAV